MPLPRRLPTWLNIVLSSAISALVIWRILALMDTEEDVFGDPRDRARIRLHFVQQYVESLKVHQRMPQTIEEVLAGLADRREYFAIDPWDSRIRFTRDSTGYELRSAGPDSSFNTTDDIVTTGRVK